MAELDSDYLKRVLPTLADGLTLLAQKQPDDGIEWLAHWLLKHADDLDHIKRTNEEEILLARQREDYLREQEAKRLLALEQERIRKQLEAERLEREEKERIARHLELLMKYDERKEKFTQEQAEKKAALGDKEPSPLEKAKQWMNFIREELKGLTQLQYLIQQFSGFKAEEDKSKIQVLQGVVYLLGHSRRTASDLALLKKVFESRSLPTVWDRIQHLRPHRSIKVPRLKNVRTATKGLQHDEILSPKSGNYAVFLLFEWLRLAVDLRNVVVQAKIQNAERLEPDEEIVFGVGEAGAREAVPEMEDDESDVWMNAEESEESEEEEEGDGTQSPARSGDGSEAESGVSTDNESAAEDDY